MKTVQTTRRINSSIEKVFQTISDVRNFAKAVPGITSIEFVSDQQTGVGTRFRETRSMNGKEQTVELEVAELVENDRVRMISDAGGTIWDTMFTVEQDGDCVVMNMKMDAKPHKLMARLITPLIMGMVAKHVESDMDSVAEYCENG